MTVLPLPSINHIGPLDRLQYYSSQEEEKNRAQFYRRDFNIIRGGCDPFFKYFDRFFISEIYLHKDKLQNSIYTWKSFLYAFYYFLKNCSFSHVTKKRIDTLMMFFLLLLLWMNKFFKWSFKKSFDSVNPLFFELIIATAII